MARALKKIKRHPDSVVVNKATQKGFPEEINTPKLEIEPHSSKKDESILEDKKPESFIGGPSSW